MMYTDLGVLLGIGNDCEPAGDSDLLSDYAGEESEFDAEDRWNCDTVCSLGGAGRESFPRAGHSEVA